MASSRLEFKDLTLFPVTSFFENTFSIVRHLPHGGKRMAHIGDDFFVDFSKYFFSFPTEIVIQESAFNTWPEYGTDSYGCSSNIMRDIFFFFFSTTRPRVG